MYTIKLDIGSWSSPAVGGGYVLANPLMDGAVISKKRESDFNRISKITISGGFTFKDNSNEIDEFTILSTIKNGGNIFINAKIYYNNNERLSGIINLETGDWDENKNIATIKFQSQSEYSELLKKSNNKYNIKDVAIETVDLNYHSKLFTQTSICYNGTWEEYKIDYRPDKTTRSHDPDDWIPYSLINTVACSGGFKYTYVTNVIPFEASGYLESIDLSTKFRTVTGEYNLQSVYRCNNSTVEEVVKWHDFTEFIKLFDLIEYILSQIDPTLSISESTYCTYFTVDKPEYNYIMISDKSDIINWDAANKAGFEEITFSLLMSYLKGMFNLEFIIDGGVFKLIRPETLSLPNLVTLPKHDFTTINNGQSVVNNQELYTYLTGNKYTFEKWVFETSSYFVSTNAIPTNIVKDILFTDEQIDYNSLDDNFKEIDMINVNNNTRFLREEQVAFSGIEPQAPSTDGFSFMAVEIVPSSNNSISFYFDSGLEFYDNPTKVNYVMSADYLVKNNQLTDRSYNKGTIDGLEVSLTKRPDREVNYANIPIYDINDLDFGFLVKTDVGNVTPISIEIDMTLKDFSKFKGVF